jgi:surface-anchored protein
LEPGIDVWVLPAGQPEAAAAGLVWPGFQSYGVGTGVLENDQVIARLSNHEGAGRFLGFANPEDELTPPELYLDPENGGDEFVLSAGVHVHMNWAFTEDGMHRLSFELEATTLLGEALHSGAHIYRFFFGELSMLPSTEPTIVMAEGMEESYASGAELRLTAARYGMPSSLSAAWAVQCSDLSGGEPGPWRPLGTGDELLTTAQAGCQYVACLMDGTSVAAISQPVNPYVD